MKVPKDCIRPSAHLQGCACTGEELLCGCVETGQTDICEGGQCPGHSACLRCGKVIPMDERSRFALNAEMIREKIYGPKSALWRRGAWVCAPTCEKRT